jgi:hypothetical protein
MKKNRLLWQPGSPLCRLAHMESDNYFYPTMVCWMCDVVFEGDNLIRSMRSVNLLPKSYSMVLIGGSAGLEATGFLARVGVYENCGSVIDSYTCFCDKCMKITMHTQKAVEGLDGSARLLHSLHYMQNALLELDQLRAFDLIPNLREE